MKLRKLLLTGSVMALSWMSASAFAAVSAEEAAKLGKELTPVGAERAGNGGAIPEWTGGLTEIPAGYKNDGKYVNPFPDDKPLFIITHKNAEQYKENLTPGQLALLAKYPDTYKIPVYQTRRTASFPQKVYDIAKQNATTVELAAGGNGLVNYQESFPFPILSGDDNTKGLQVIWNHIGRYVGDAIERTIVQVTPLPNGSYSPVRFKEEIVSQPALTDFNPNEERNILYYFKQAIVSPARLAGNVLLVHETINQVEEPRMAWIYNSGQRRVRRAPQVAYDGPGTAADGMRTSDNFDMFNGAPDRYNWKLLGKKEIYIPYNSYELSSPKYKYDDIVKPGHLNQDLTRYELHRVWVVEATLKEGQRHVYGKRVFYVDEDTWQAAEIDHYDGRGELWRVAEGHTINYYDAKVNRLTVETLYDLLSGRYLALNLTNEEQPGTIRFGTKRSKADFTPAALRQAGVR